MVHRLRVVLRSGNVDGTVRARPGLKIALVHCRHGSGINTWRSHVLTSIVLGRCIAARWASNKICNPILLNIVFLGLGLRHIDTVSHLFWHNPTHPDIYIYTHARTQARPHIRINTDLVVFGGTHVCHWLPAALRGSVLHPSRWVDVPATITNDTAHEHQAIE